jgi:hypothetical protein
LTRRREAQARRWPLTGAAPSSYLGGEVAFSKAAQIEENNFSNPYASRRLEWCE